MATQKTRPRARADEPEPTLEELRAENEALRGEIAKQAEKRSEVREQRLAKEREALVASGELLVCDSGAEFVRANDRKKDTTKQRAAQLVERLKSSDEPLVAKQLEAEIGGGSSFYIAFFAMHEALEYIERFRVLGERQAAYKWVGPR